MLAEAVSDLRWSRLIVQNQTFFILPLTCYVNLYLTFFLLSRVQISTSLASQVVPVVKNPPANAGGVKDTGSIPRSGRSPGGRYSNPLQYSCLENPMSRGAWHATMHRVTKSWMQLKGLGMPTHPHHWNCYLLPRRGSMVLHTQRPETTHISCPQFLWVKSPGVAQLDPWQDWSQSVWQGWGIIWDLTGGGFPFMLTENVSKMDVLVVVGLRTSFSSWPFANHRPLAFSKPAREREASRNQAIV